MFKIFTTSDNAENIVSPFIVRLIFIFSYSGNVKNRNPKTSKNVIMTNWNEYASMDEFTGM